METIEALAKALNKFKVGVSASPPDPVSHLSPSPVWRPIQGGVILVSHDERLIRLVCKELWVCDSGKVWRVDGGFDEYRDILQEQFKKEGYLWGPAPCRLTTPTKDPGETANKQSEHMGGPELSSSAQATCCEVIGCWGHLAQSQWTLDWERLEFKCWVKQNLLRPPRFYEIIRTRK